MREFSFNLVTTSPKPKGWVKCALKPVASDHLEELFPNYLSHSQFFVDFTVLYNKCILTSTSLGYKVSHVFGDVATNKRRCVCVIAENLGWSEDVVYYLVMTLNDIFEQTNFKINARSDHFYFRTQLEKQEQLCWQSIKNENCVSVLMQWFFVIWNSKQQSSLLMLLCQGYCTSHTWIISR